MRSHASPSTATVGGRLDNVRAMQRRVLISVCVLTALLCSLAAVTAASLPNNGWQAWAKMAVFVPVFLGIAVCAWRQWLDLDLLGAGFFTAFGLIMVLRIHTLVYGPIFTTPDLPLFMPVYAFVPLVYVSGAVVSSARAAVVGNTVFWLACVAVVMPQLWPMLDTPAATTRGGFQLMYWLLGANPVMIALIYVTQTIRSQLEAAEGEVFSLRERQQLVDQLEESKTRLDLAIRGSSDGMWDWFDVNDDREWWSPRFYELIGHTPEAMPASFENFGKLVHPDDLPVVERAVTAHFEQGVPYQAEFRMRDSGGVYRWFVARGDSVRDADGKPLRMAGSLRDVHDRKLAEEALHTARAQLQSVLDYAPSLIYAKTLEGRYILGNDRWKDAVDPQARVDDLLGKTDTELFGAKNAESFAAEDDEVARQGQVLRFDNVIELDGHTLHFLTDKFPLRDTEGRIYAVGGISTEVTDLVNAQTELQASNADLERYSYIVSHDLAAPLRAITGFAQLLASKHGDELSAGAKDYLEQIESGAASMRRMIDALLDLSRAGGNVDPSPVNLNAVVDEARQRLATVLEDSEAELSVEPLPEAWGHHDQLVQVLQNLLQNAAKFRRNDVPLRIDITAAEAAEQVVLCVADNGIGINTDKPQAIFGIFQKLHHESEYPGQGLGLAICEKIIKAHGGSIALKPPPPEPGQHHGATFEIRLPRPPARTAG